MKSPPEIFAKLTVDLGERSYPIVIGKHLLEQTAFADYIPGSRVVIVTNTIVAPLYLERLSSMLTAAGKHCLSIVLPDGEEEKSIDNLMKVFDALLENKCDRKTTLLALGGGVIGDLTVPRRLARTVKCRIGEGRLQGHLRATPQLPEPRQYCQRRLYNKGSD